MQLRLAERYLGKIAHLSKETNQILLPANLTNFDDVMEGLSLEDFSLPVNGKANEETAPSEQSDDGV